MSADVTTTPARWEDVFQVLEFVESRFQQWQKEGTIRTDQGQAIAAHYRNQREAWQRAADSGSTPPTDLGLPPADEKAPPTARAYRGWHVVGQEVKRHEAAGRLALAQVHACGTEVNERLAALQARLEKEQALPAYEGEVEVEPAIYQLQPLAPPATRREALKPKKPRTPRRNLLEILLDPRSIQWLLASGGALMVLGLVIWLYVNEYFTKEVVALALGLTNAAFLAGGWSIIRYTRHEMAGKAVTLLACLVMPLNLWYYHTNGLITVDGHLWVAAVVISVLYAASAWVLKDEVFVYVFAAGVTLTGLLLLANLPPSPQRFWEIASPATLLVALGLLGIHAERAFPEQEGPFSRRRFGRAFFFSGHAQLAAGLILMLGAQIAGDWLYDPIFKTLYDQWQAQPSPIVTQWEMRLLALGLVLAATYAYIYSDLAVRRVGVYVYIAAFTLLWAEVLGVELLNLQLGVDAIIAILAGTALLVNAIQATVTRNNQYTRAFPVLGLLLGIIPVLMGLTVYMRALSGNLHGVWEAGPPAWSYVGAILLTAVSCRFGAHLYRHGQPRLSALYFFGTAVATMIAAVALLSALGLTKWADHAPWMMLIPIFYLVAARLYRGHSSEKPLLWCAHAATGVMLISSLATALDGFTRLVEGQPANLLLALFCAEASVFYGLAAVWYKQMRSLQACVILACGALWQLLTYAGVHAEVYTLTFAMLGLGLLVIYRFALLRAVSAGPMALGSFHAANTLLSLSLLASWFMGLSRIATQGVNWSYVGLCLGLGVMAVAAIKLVREPGWRRWYVVATIGQGLLTFLAVQALSQLSPAQKLEIFSVVVGVVLLVIGHIGWYREQDRHSDMVSLSLLLGSVLTCLPLAVATLIDRGRGDFSGIHVANELGFLAASVLLLVTGFLFQLRSTTLTGAASTATYFLTLLLYVPWSRLGTVGVFIFAVGLAIFLPALLLSLYRDRLAALPEKLRKRQGVFRVLSWR